VRPIELLIRTQSQPDSANIVKGVLGESVTRTKRNLRNVQGTVAVRAQFLVDHIGGFQETDPTRSFEVMELRVICGHSECTDRRGVIHNSDDTDYLIWERANTLGLKRSVGWNFVCDVIIQRDCTRARSLRQRVLEFAGDCLLGLPVSMAVQGALSASQLTGKAQSDLLDQDHMARHTRRVGGRSDLFCSP
jgi:hypothetical protein